MSVFKNERELFDCIGGLFDWARGDKTVAADLKTADMVVRLSYSDPDAALTIDLRDKVEWHEGDGGLEAGVGVLLGEVQRIKSTGDYEGAREIFESYGIHFDAALRDEVVARVDALELPSYTGFVQPRLEAIRDGDGNITDVQISYPLDLTTQMLEYSGRQTFAPVPAVLRDRLKK